MLASLRLGSKSTSNVECFRYLLTRAVKDDHDYNEVGMFLRQTGFSIEKVISTLFQSPGRVNHIKLPRQSVSADAGFTVILVGKTAA